MYIKLPCAVRSSVCIKPPVSEPVCVYKILCAKAVLSRTLLPKISPSNFHAFLLAKLSPNYFHGFPSVQHAVSLPPSETLRKLYLHGFIPSSYFRNFIRSPPAKFPRAISTASSRLASGLAPSLRNFPKLFPQAISTASSRPASGLVPSQRTFPKLFSTVLSRPASGRAPSKRNFPKLFPRLHPFLHPVSLPPSEVSPRYFYGFIPSSIRSRFLPAKFFPGISTASSRPASCHAPSQRSFPKLFPRSCPVQHPVSLPPSAVSPGFSTASSRRASGLAPSQRSFPKPFPRLHHVEHPVSLPPSEVSLRRFHGFRPPSIRSRSLPAQFSQGIFTASSGRTSGLAPSQGSFPNYFHSFTRFLNYFHGFIPSSIRLPPSAVSPSHFPKLFSLLHPVEHPVSLPPSENFPKRFPRLHPVEHRVLLPKRSFPKAISTASSRPASGLAPSQRSFPKYPPGFIPSSIRSRSFPAKFP